MKVKCSVCKKKFNYDDRICLNHKEYKAKLIGRDGFVKIMSVIKISPQIFVPLKEKLNAFLESPDLLSNPVSEHRIFNLDKDKSWQDVLVYNEI